MVARPFEEVAEVLTGFFEGTFRQLIVVEVV
jgi:hypothetical protein